MAYRMHIKADEPVTIMNVDTRKMVTLEVDCKYIFDPLKPTTKKDRSNKGRIVKILGFNADFMATGVIVRYLDNNRRGMVSPIYLIPYKENA